jgi:hypothetical protein
MLLEWTYGRSMRLSMLWYLYSVTSAASAIVQTTVPCGIWYHHFGYRLTRLIATDTAYVILIFVKKHRIITSYKCTEVLRGKTLCKLLRTERLNKVKYKHRYCEQYGIESSSHSQKLIHDSFCLQNFTFLYFVRLAWRWHVSLYLNIIFFLPRNVVFDGVQYR